MATIVLKLLTGLVPNRAYFGEKDYQQLSIIHALVAQKKLSVQIVNCPIVREEDGLAMSSRNTRLSKDQRAIAPLIYQTLLEAKALKEKKDLPQIKQWVEAFSMHILPLSSIIFVLLMHNLSSRPPLVVRRKN